MHSKLVMLNSAIRPKLILTDRVPQLSAEPSKAGTLSPGDPLGLEIIPNLSSCQNKLRKKMICRAIKLAI